MTYVALIMKKLIIFFCVSQHNVKYVQNLSFYILKMLYEYIIINLLY